MNRSVEPAPATSPGSNSPGIAASSATQTSLLGTPLAFAVTILVTLVLFFPILGFAFAPVDDAPNVLANPFLLNPAHQNIGYFFLHPYYLVYMPMTFSLWALCARIAPLSVPQEMPLTHTLTYLNPEVYHAASLLLHVASTALVFVFLRRFRFLPWACAAGALLFAVHPVQIDSVAWVTGANNLTAGFFCLLALNLYVRGVPYDPAAEQANPARERLFLGMATIVFVCALLSKPTASVLPLTIATMEALVFRRPWRRWIGLFSFWCLLSIICALISRASTDESTGTVWSPLWGRPFVAGDALAFYVTKLAAPMIGIDYERPPVYILHQWWGYIDWLLPALVLGAMWFWPARRLADAGGSAGPPIRWLRVAVLLFLCGLVSTLGIVPFYSQWNSTVADRYLYFAMIGPAVAAAYLLSRPARLLSITVIGASVAIIVFGSLTSAQLPVWANSYNLVQYIAMIEPRAPMVRQLAGDVLAYRGDYEQALQQYEEAERRWGQESLVNNRKIALTLARLGRYDEAIKPITNCVLAASNNDTDWVQLWSLLPHARHTERLETIMKERLFRNPRDGRAAFTLGAILLYRGSQSAALPYLTFGVQSSPNFTSMQYDFGVMLEGMNRLPEAEAQYRRALSLDPGNQQAAAALALLRQRTGQ